MGEKIEGWEPDSNPLHRLLQIADVVIHAAELARAFGLAAKSAGKVEDDPKVPTADDQLRWVCQAIREYGFMGRSHGLFRCACARLVVEGATYTTASAAASGVFRGLRGVTSWALSHPLTPTDLPAASLLFGRTRLLTVMARFGLEVPLVVAERRYIPYGSEWSIDLLPAGVGEEPVEPGGAEEVRRSSILKAGFLRHSAYLSIKTDASSGHLSRSKQEDIASDNWAVLDALESLCVEKGIRSPTAVYAYLCTPDGDSLKRAMTYLVASQARDKAQVVEKDWLRFIRSKRTTLGKRLLGRQAARDAVGRGLPSKLATDATVQKDRASKV